MKYHIFNTKTVHIVSWILYAVLMFLFYSNITNTEIALSKTSQTVSLHIIIFYFNTRILMPKFAEKNKIWLYVFSLIITFIIIILILHYLKMDNRPPDFRIKHNFLDPIKDDKNVFRIRNIIRYSSSIIIILLFSIVYRVVSKKDEEEKRKTLIKNENLETEMKFLKSQINPHFLFNSINNIYTLVLLKSDKAPASLMKLSEMLRYMLYESNISLVPIEKEIDYINSYIGMQQLKTEEKQNIDISIKIESNSIKIPPLLLIPFIENSFKHCDVTNTKTEWVKIDIVVTKKAITFRIENSISNNRKDKTGGIGLTNVRRRLELIYPGKFKLEIHNLIDLFSVSLKINLER